MIIYTTNDHGRRGRRIERARRRLNGRNFGYSNHTGTGPSLQVVLDGTDGKSYTVTITKEDIAALDDARKYFATELGAPHA